MFVKEQQETSDEEDLAGEDEAEGTQFPHNYSSEVHGHDFRQAAGCQQYVMPLGYPPGYCNASSFGASSSHQLDFDPTQQLHYPKHEFDARMMRRVDMPLFFLGDAPFCSAVDPREVYCTVPGRTSLLSSTTKYRVTVGEIQRRISAPECLNASLLGGILRKAKSKDGGKTLRDSLKKIGLALPAGRRKQAHVTALTALVEEEAVHMARDFALVCEKEFRAREIGVFLTKANLAIDHDAVKRRTILEHSKKVVSELCDLVAADRTPLTPFAGIQRTTPLLDPAIQQHLSHFTLMTHGFGGVAMLSVLQSLRAVIDEGLKYLDRVCPQPIYLPYAGAGRNL